MRPPPAHPPIPSGCPCPAHASARRGSAAPNRRRSSGLRYPCQYLHRPGRTTKNWGTVGGVPGGVRLLRSWKLLESASARSGPGLWRRSPLVSRRLTRALAATVLGAGMLAPAATFISQGTAHAVLDENGEDGIVNTGAQNGFDSDLVFAGDQVNLFN